MAALNEGYSERGGVVCGSFVEDPYGCQQLVKTTVFVKAVYYSII